MPRVSRKYLEKLNTRVFCQKIEFYKLLVKYFPNTVAKTDRDFDVNAELMVHDIDDEATLDEEETLEAGEGFNEEEIDDLQKVCVACLLIC